MAMRWLQARPSSGPPLVGTFVQIADPAACEALARSGLDFYCVDAEHAALSRRDVDTMIRALDTGDAPCIVRTADDSYAAIAGALDAGASGVLVPRVESGEQAAAIVAAATFPPRGVRGAGPARAAEYGRSLPQYLVAAQEHLLVGVQIETRAGVEALDIIAATPGIDLLFVGPGDLSVSYQLAYGSVELDRLVDDTLRRISRTGKLAGLFCPSWDGRPPAAQRAEILIVSSDLGELVGSMTRLARDASPASLG
jgi:4-hydroxy-2-oxoheptanedioate aldolase